MFRIGIFIVGLIVIGIGIFISIVPLLSFLGLIIVLVGLLILGGAFSKHKVVNKNNDNFTSTTKSEKQYKPKTYDNMYECGTCKGTGEVWVCSHCGGYAKLELEDRDGFNLYCEKCELSGEKYDIVEGTCPMCEGKGSF